MESPSQADSAATKRKKNKDKLSTINFEEQNRELMKSSLPESTILDDIEKRESAPNLEDRKKAQKKPDTAGAKWFDLPVGKVTPELKLDLKLLSMRNFIDPKHHYKRSKQELPKYFQVGRVVESAADFYSARLTNKERKNTLADEILQDQAVRKYSKRKFLEIQKAKQSGGKKYFNSRKSKRQKSFG